MRYSDVSLNQMANFIKNHLNNNCVVNRLYRLPEENAQSDKESDIIIRNFKKARVSNFFSSLQWEHFSEVLEETSFGTKERAHGIQEFFRSMDLPESKYLNNMFN